MRVRTASLRVLVSGAALSGLVAYSSTLLSSQSSETARATEPTHPTGLATIFDEGVYLLDRNVDGLIDDLDLRLVLPDDPAPEERVAALTLAARFGLETSGLSLPVAVSAQDAGDLAARSTVIIGKGNRLLSPGVRARLDTLPAGHGLVALEGPTLVVAGADPEGTQAAAEAFAARSPYLWAVIGRDQGDTFDRIASDVWALLADQQIGVEAVRFDEVTYARDRDQAVHLRVAVRVTDAAAARAAVAEVATLHRRGRATDRLTYSSVATLLVHLTDGRSTHQVTLPRVGVPQRLLTPPRQRPTRFARPRADDADSPPPSGRRFDLADVFTTGEGLLSDRNDDRIADDVETMIVLPATPMVSTPGVGVAQLGARLGLESTGLSFPIAGLDSELEDPSAESRPLIYVGRGNRWITELDRLGKLRGDALLPGAGRVELVPNAFGGQAAVVVTGGDAPGQEAAIDYLSRRAPSVWETGKHAATLSEVRESVRRLLEGRTTAAQGALAIDALDEIVRDLGGAPVEAIEVRAYFEEAAPAFDTWVRSELERRLPGSQVEVSSHRRLAPTEVFRETPDLPWEVDVFWERFRAEALPQIRAGADVEVELRVSESPELRRELASEIAAEIARRGGRPHVSVLSAYKQGLSWLMDEVAPALAQLPVAGVTITWRPLEVDTSQPWRFFNEPSRWLNELYPADDVLVRRLGLPLEAIEFDAVFDAQDIYTVTAHAENGATLFRESFSPRFYERPYLQAFPETQVLVTTGWLRVDVDTRMVVNARIPTDLDVIWDHYQTSTLARVHDAVKASTGGRPTSDKAPFFHTLRAELQASEPDFQLGIDQEHVSSLESLHDSFYFDTMDFFYEVVEAAADDDTVAPRSLAAGNILPWIHPERRGRAPALTITYSEFASKVPKVEVTYRRPGEDSETVTRMLEPVETPRPYVYAAEVRAGEPQLEGLGLLVTLDDDEGLARATRLLDGLSRLQQADAFTSALAFDGVDHIAIRVEAPGAGRTRSYPSPSPERTDARPVPYRGERLVTWDHVIGPEESERIAHTLGTTPHVTTYVAGRSYQGRPVSVMEIALPMQATLVSQAKMAAWKPVLSIVGRQHANEVSSTSHILRLAELLATDPAYQRYLRRMNVVVQPVVNPDGAALAYELQRLTPTHCLHAGRYSALGPDVPGQSNNPDTLITEALVLSEIDDAWVPDVRLNPHGYPSHEWVQHFANYNPKSFRSYWIPRGWYTSARVPEHPQLDTYRRITLAMHDRIAEEVGRDPEVRETNARIYDRYRRWAIRWQPHVYNLEIHNDTAIYASRRGGTVRRPTPRPPSVAFSGGTEAMDETAQGPWLDLVSQMGFGYLMASVKFLDESIHELYRVEEERQGRVSLEISRPRPVVPARPAAAGAR